MYKNERILINKLARTFGFYQTTNPDYPVVSPSLSSPTKDKYVNDVHGLINPERIDQSLNSYTVFNYDNWGGDTLEYEGGVLVQSSGSYYEAIQDVPTGISLNNTTYWFELDDYNNYLHQKRFQAAKHALNKVFNGKKLRAKIKSIYENISLYDGRANYRDKVKNNNLFVGLSFVVKRDNNIVITINEIGHQFTELFTDVPLYLYHSSQQEPITTFQFSQSKAKSSEWTILNNDGTNELRYWSDNHDTGGRWWLGYAQSDIGTSQALKMYGLDWIVSGSTCGSCSKTRSNYKIYSNWVDVRGFSVSESSFNVGVDIFDPDTVAYSADNNYGLNIKMTNDCDLTPFMLSHDHLFAEAMNNVCGYNILKDLSSNTRGTNGLAVEVKEEASKELYKVQGVDGTVKDIMDESLDALSFDLSSLQSECLPCDDKRPQLILPKVTFR